MNYLRSKFGVSQDQYGQARIILRSTCHLSSYVGTNLFVIHIVRRNRTVFENLNMVQVEFYFKHQDVYQFAFAC